MAEMSVARTALVTGGNRGIGFEACRRLARAGLRIVLTARNAGKGEEAAGTCGAKGDLLDAVLAVE